jgi:alcohol dehydrogenase, propanol-preferring
MPSAMKAWVINKTGNILEENDLLDLIECGIPLPGDNEILIKVTASGICHTELDEIEGRTPPSSLPMIPGHQIVGKVVSFGKKVKKFREGDKAAIAWIGAACGNCGFCKSGLENLCPDFKATGRDMNGGYAEFAKVKEDFAYKISLKTDDEHAAPLLCAGAVGYRSLKLTGIKNGEPLGFTGFGASAHLVLKLAKELYPKSGFYVFARSENERGFARALGAAWTGDTEDKPPVKLKAIIDTTPVWKTIVAAMDNLEPGGRLVINAIRKEESDKDELLSMDYGRHLWLEKEIKSVANVTRKDVEEFLKLAFEYTIKPEVEIFAFDDALKALKEIKEKKIKGAKVIKI